MLTELNLKTFAISFNYQVRLQKAIQLGPAIQFLSFIVYLVCTCMSRSQSRTWNLQRPTAETSVSCFTKRRPFISEVNNRFRCSLVILSIYIILKVKNDHRSKFSSLSNWKEKIKASTRFEP